MSFEGGSGRYKLKSGILTVNLQKRQKKFEDSLKKNPPSTSEELQSQLETFNKESEKIYEEFLGERFEDLEDDDSKQSGTFSVEELAKLLSDTDYFDDQQIKKLNEAEWLQILSQKPVVLHFFTYCCSNCLCVFPNLKPLESLSKNLNNNNDENLLIISIHGPKFPEETNNLQQAIQKYDINHVVVSDKQKKIFDVFGISSWPSFLLFSPVKNLSIVYFGSGEDSLNVLKGGITVGYEPKIQIFISDSHNHRIVICDSSLTPQFFLGNSQGFSDGNFSEVQFNFPQGLYFDSEEQNLYVADTWNHSIRKIDFKHKNVTTIIGNGKKSSGIIFGGLKGNEISLSLPWDVEIYEKNDEKFLLFSNANSHQIWSYNFKTKITLRLAGSGIEANRNSTSFKITAFAQPSGISIGKNEENIDVLFIADSESSSIRYIPLEWLFIDQDPKKSQRSSKTIVGGDSKNYFNLTAFGDIDGKSPFARLAHPLDVFWNSKFGLFVVDTFNHKIKIVNVKEEKIETFIFPKEVKLLEPSSLTILEEENDIFLLICNTNLHKIEKIKIN